MAVRRTVHDERHPIGEQLREGLDEVRIELQPAVPAELLDRGFVGDRVAVWAPGHHRLVGIGDRDDPGTDGDLLPGEAVWIPATVEPFVMVEHDRGRVAQRAGLLEDDLADLGMLRDDPPLGVVELARLGQDLLGDGELAEVVEQAGDPDPLDLALRAAPGPSASSTAAPAIIDDGLPAQPGRASSAAVSESVAAPKAARPTSIAWVRALGAMAARRTSPLSSSSWKTYTWSRPSALALYIALSASRTRFSRARCPPNPPATPAESVAAARKPSSRPISWRPTSRRSFSASDAAASTSVSGRTIRNSSPPYRPDHVDGPQVGPQDVGDLAEHQVARGVAVRVVESLEVIDVDHHDGQLVAVAGRPRDFLLELGEDGLAVEDAGQVIDRGEGPGLGQPLRQLPKLARSRGSSIPFASARWRASVAEARRSSSSAVRRVWRRTMVSANPAVPTQGANERDRNGRHRSRRSPAPAGTCQASGSVHLPGVSIGLNAGRLTGRAYAHHEPKVPSGHIGAGAPRHLGVHPIRVAAWSRESTHSECPRPCCSTSTARLSTPWRPGSPRGSGHSPTLGCRRAAIGSHR